ncbi:hypothetical protein GDO86_013312 [Hymenochirus boettgeri]|nr:hypothetical protein GDO86_013312 [Hymenochirus boettgeri]
MTTKERSLAKGSPAPGPVPEGIIRVYSMRYCPFAHRARLVLAAKGIKHDLININTMNKPEWFLDKNPFGMVPTLENSRGQVIYESPIVCDYLDEVYPGKNLTPKDPFQKAQQKMLLEHFNKAWPLLFKIVSVKKNNSEEASDLKTEFLEKLMKFDEVLAKKKSPFFGGNEVSMIDYMMWPFFERFSVFEVMDCLNKTLHVNMWYELMMQDPAVQAECTHPEVLLGFFKLYTQGNPEAVDYGI